MTVWTLGINHETAPLDVRGRFVVPTDQLGPRVMHLRDALQGQAEATLLSTCN
ncbi:MAG: glutamyl-tRNA reductase, partial [Burkholderiaceae bacterium]|nr:glutamyl-tRNA reductase [Burkholderiaceae bacterium]